MKNPRFFIPILLALGIFYRAILVASYPQPFVADQTQYHDIAIGILKNGIFADPTRTYGYPMIVAIWYSLFGVGNVLAWKLIQILGDALIALLIYFISKDLFGRKLPAAIAFVLYIASPFVAAYAGMLLSEVSAVFCMALILLLWHRFFQTKKILYLFPAVFFMGYLPQIRPVFFYFMIILFVTTLFLMRKMNITWYNWILVTVAFLLPFSYAIAGNYLLFHRISPLTVDGGFSRQLIASEYMEGRAPHPIDKPGGFPDRVGEMEWALRFPYDATYRDNLAKSQLQEGLLIMKQNPWHFIETHLLKMWYVWEKHYLFIFTQEPRIVEITAYTLNSFLLLFGVVGIVFFGRQHKQPHQRIFWWLCVSLLFYTSAVHMISDAEQRYSLPAYPILFIFAGYALTAMKNRI